MSDVHPATRPRRRTGVREYPVVDELVLAHPDGDGAISFNASAQAIWELCDGTRTVQEIARDLEQLLELGPGRLLDDVISAVTSFAEHGLVEWEGS